MWRGTLSSVSYSVRTRLLLYPIGCFALLFVPFVRFVCFIVVVACCLPCRRHVLAVLIGASSLATTTAISPTNIPCAHSRGNVPLPVNSTLTHEATHRYLSTLPRQAKPPAEAFIGYGGVTVREAVQKGADWYVRDFGLLIEAIGESGGAKGG